MSTPERAVARPPFLPVNTPGERTVDRVLQWAQWQPHAPAVSDDTRALSYGALADAIHTVADQLKAEDLRPGERIMVIGENSVALTVMLLAASHCGVCAVVENVRRMPAEIAGILAHSLPRRVFVIGVSAEARRHAEALGARPQHNAALGDFSVAIPVNVEVAASADDAGPMPDDIAIIIYTTGTTGQPKGVMLTHGNLIFIAAMMRALRHLSPRDRVYGVLPATHVMGHASVMLGALHNGAALHLVARFDAARCVATLTGQRITCIQGAPAMFASIAAYCKQQAATVPDGSHRGKNAAMRHFPDVRFIGSGGAPIDVTIKAEAEALFGCELQNGYGLTEAASICWTRFDDANTDDNVGPPLPGVEICLRDSAGRTVDNGEVGELWMRGPNLMAGYFRNPEQTRRVVDAEGWFNTQDLARSLPDGRLLIVGRTKDVIVRSGFNVYPLEVEAALNTHPAVLHSAVVGRSVPGNEEVVAYVELAAAGSADVPALAAHVAGLLSPYKRPAEIVIVPTLPLAANGKVLKSQLAQVYARPDHTTQQPGDRP